MKQPPPNFGGWSRRRFWTVVTMIFAAQAGLILLFAEGSRIGSHGIPAPVHFHLLDAPLTADELSKKFFAIDPTVFPLPGPHGFSQRAWLELSPPHFDVTDQTEMPAWLPLDEGRLGTNFPALNHSTAPMPFSLADKGSADLDQWPAALSVESISNTSSFELEGELTAREINPPGVLQAWTNAQVLSNSVVQIAVNASGQVVAARLLGRSGLADADMNALSRARQLRFRPVRAATPVWGRAVFSWQTLEQTNSTETGLP